MRRFVIGDIHGCAKALRSLIESIDPQQRDEVVFLGDYIDRGPDSRNVIDQVIELSRRCRVVSLRGNHEIMLQGVAFGGLDAAVWLANGGQATVSSYGGSLDKIPVDHLFFLQQLLPYYETDDEIFVHASYDPMLPMNRQTDNSLYWEHLSEPPPLPHKSGKTVFLGHTPQPGGRVLDRGHLVCVDTYCFGDGYLTALETRTGEVIQTTRSGHRRRAPMATATFAFRDFSRRTYRRCVSAFAAGRKRVRNPTAIKRGET